MSSHGIQALVTEGCTTFATSVTPSSLAYAVLGKNGGPQGKDLYAASSSPLPIDMMLYSLQQFILKKARQESIYALLCDLRKELKAEPLDTLFATTRAFLDTLNDDSPASAIAQVRDAFKQDLDALPVRAVAYLQRRSPFAQSMTDRIDYQLRLVIVLIPLVNGIVRGQDPVEALGQLTELQHDTPPNESEQTINQGLVMIGILARIYHTLDGMPPYKKKLLYTSVVELLQDPHTGQHLIELCRQTVDVMGLKIPGGDSAAFEARFAKPIYDLVVRLAALQSAVNSARLGQGRSAEQRDAANLAVLDACLRVIELVPSLPLTDDQSDEWTGTWNAIHERIVASVDLYRALVTQRYSEAVTRGIALAGSLSHGYQITGPATRWLQVGSSLAMATSTEEVENALDAASPIGSFRRKRNGGAYLLVNAYVGGGVGAERSVGGLDNGSYAGVAVPVGLELGVGTSYPFPSSIGVLATLIDFGNVTSTRLDSTAADQRIRFQQVFAPGGYLMLGISHDYPISIGIGGERAVDIRDSPTGEPVSGWHFGGFIGIDVPLL